jgi:hypothetical protein
MFAAFGSAAAPQGEMILDVNCGAAVLTLDKLPYGYKPPIKKVISNDT